MKHIIRLISVLVLFLAFSGFQIDSREGNVAAKHVLEEADSFAVYARDLYEKMALGETKLDYTVFEKALTGYYVLRGNGLVTNKKMSIVDFDQPSTSKRLWILDLAQKKVLFHTLVAHGKNSGEDIAVNFSNKNQSFMSSLGFYVTGHTYTGKHGLSLVLHGMDGNYNSNAKERAIVLHGADYVSEEFIQCNGRLGRSHGCPAVPSRMHKDIIEQIQQGSVLFLNKSMPAYKSEYLNKQKAEEAMKKDDDLS